VVVDDEERYPGFRAFVAARSSALARTAFLLTGDAQAAEDLLQEALARVAGRWRRVVAGGDPEPYVRRVIYTVHVSRWRKHRGREWSGAVPDGPVGPDLAELSAGRLTVRSALDDLTPKQRAVIVLRFYEDLTERQAADVLGVSISTVKAQTVDALIRLRRHPERLLDIEPEEVTS
jgi:RNA polymerase sigma-70 factor (sigma-E family)